MKYPDFLHSLRTFLFFRRNFEKIFYQNLLQAVDYSGFLYNLGIDIEDIDEIALERCKKRVTFRKWQNAMKKIVSYELEHGNVRWRSTTFPLDIRTECEKIIYYSLKDTEMTFKLFLNYSALTK